MTVTDHELPSLSRPLLEPHPQAWSDSFNGLKDGRAVFWALESLRPEFLSRRKAHHADRSKTAWLDGLRGWAALIVCFVHLTVYTHPGIESCYGAPLPFQLGVSGEPRNITPAAWPILRVLWNGGHFAVMVFFTISGYVLTKRLISLLHEGRQADFVSALHSSICRRPLRLFLPVLWSTLILLTVWHVTGFTTPWPPRKDNIFLELVAWMRESGKFVFFFRTGFLFTYYNIHTWTIPVELRGSLFLFVWLFAVSQMAHKTRFMFTMGMVLYLVFVSPGAMYATFFAGMVTAELDLIASGAAQMSLPWDRLKQALGSHGPVRAIVLHAILVSALYLGGQPAGDGDLATKEKVLGTCHGWATLSKLIPEAYPSKGSESATHRWFWLFWASWLLVIACKEISWLKRGLESRMSQYLGRVSFALYLVHGPMIGLLSERLFYLTGVKKGPLDPDAQAKFGHLLNKWYDASWFPFTNDGLYGLEPNFLFCCAVSIPIFLYIAELGTKIFDTPSVRVSRWVYGRFFKAR